MPTWAYKYAAIIGVVAVIAIGSYFYGVHTEKNSYAAAVLKQSQNNAKKVAKVTQVNTTLAATNGALQQRVQELNYRLLHQPVQEHVVYVQIHPHQAPVAVTGAVYVTAGAVSLFNTSFGLSSLSTSTGWPNAASGDLSSAVTISDYENATTKNAVACYSNQQTLSELQDYVRALEKQGAIK